jgi:hypothetical protein
MHVHAPAAGWDSWGGSTGQQKAGGGATGAKQQQQQQPGNSLHKQHSVSSPNLKNSAADDDWGKW